MSFEALLTHSAIVKRKSSDERTDTGEVVDTYATVDTIRCRFHQAGTDLAIVDPGVRQNEVGSVWMGPDEDVQLNDLLEIDGREWRVIGVRSPAGLGHHKQASVADESR
jgi:hypothetical protein